MTVADFLETSMRCLIPMEQSEWLRINGQIENPYGAETASRGKLYHQFYAPPRLAQTQEFVAEFLSTWKSGEAHLVVTDWSLYSTHEMKLFLLARRAHGEERSLIDASGHVFSVVEKDDLISLFSLTVAYYWSAYLYLSSDKTCIFNWEGDIFDFWTDDPESYETLKSLQEGFRFRRTGLLSTKLYWMGKKAMWRLNRLTKVRRS